MCGLLLVFFFQTFSPAPSLPNFDIQEVSAESAPADDSLFIVARDYALEGDTRKARDIAAGLLHNNPLYHDAAVLVARTYAWENHMDSARYFVTEVLQHQPGYHDALALLANIEIWDGNYLKAVGVAETALVHHPGSHIFMVKKARALFFNGKTDEARILAEEILGEDPGNKEAAELLNMINAPGFYHYRQNNYLLGGYYGEFFDLPYERRFHMGSLGYSHYTARGPVALKVNFANTFIEGTGLTRYPSFQYELESYPRLTDDSYMLLNYAFSTGSVFPLHRGAVEYFRALPHGFEASLGLRNMFWDEHYLFFTGSAGMYYGNMWFSIRPYLFPGGEDLSASWFIFARRYFDHADSFAGIILGYGLSPDDAFAELPDRIYLRSTSIGFEFSRGIAGSYVVHGGLRYKNEEYATGSLRNYWYLNLGLRYILSGR